MVYGLFLWLLNPSEIYQTEEECTVQAKRFGHAVSDLESFRHCSSAK